MLPSNCVAVYHAMKMAVLVYLTMRCSIHYLVHGFYISEALVIGPVQVLHLFSLSIGTI